MLFRSRMLERMVDKVVGSGASVVFCQKGIDDMSQHYLSKAGILAVRRVKESDLTKLAKATGGRIITNLDVTQKDDCNAFVDQVMKKWGSVDILVNNAGLMPLSFVKNLKVDEWEQMIDVNIKGVLFMTAGVVSHMKEKKSGHIVNISSVAGRLTIANKRVKVFIARFSKKLN